MSREIGNSATREDGLRELLDEINSQIMFEMSRREQRKQEAQQRHWAKPRDGMSLLHMDLEYLDALYIVETYQMRREREQICKAIADAKEAEFSPITIPATAANPFNSHPVGASVAAARGEEESE